MIVSLAALALLSSILVDAAHPLSRHMELINDSGEKITVDWVHPKTDTNTTTNFSPGGGCAAGAQITVSNENENQVIIIKEGLQLERRVEEPILSTAALEMSQEIVTSCRKLADAYLVAGRSPEEVLGRLETCLHSRAAEVFERQNQELAFQAELRRSVSYMAENYTCADPDRESTAPIATRLWTGRDGIQREVGVLHNRPSSQIHMIKNFISPQECAAVKEAAAATLHRGTVADGQGGSKLSTNRKAWQAGIAVNWDREGDLIAAVSQRLFDYTNDVTGYNLTLEGQEDLMSIQYFGNGKKDPTPDQYRPHCDGDCDGLPHKSGGRVATMVMYCDAPDVGGATNFQNANVFVKPVVGAAAFFSYMDPVTYLHEEGFTTHSGCPVLLGTKRIAVQWMRIGVDAQNPWDSFDTNTKKLGTQEEDDDDYDDDDEYDYESDENFEDDCNVEG